MSLSIANNFPPSFAVLPNAASVALFDSVSPLPELSLNISIPDFDLDFVTTTLSVSKQMSESDQSGFQVESPIYADTNLIVNFIGSFAGDGTFKIQEVSINTDFLNESAESDFVAKTFLAAIGLAEKVRLRIPQMGLDLTLKFHSQPAEISRMLQRRQFAYRAMIVERATGCKFDLPIVISGKEVEHLAFIYYAITKRSFAFPFTFVTFPDVPATRENLERLVTANSQPSIKVGPAPVNKPFLGQTISLGDDGVFVIENAAIDNFDEIRERLAREDGRPVEVVIRSLSGQARYNLPSAPSLPAAAWDEFTQKLIDLDSDLDARLVERYHALAAATLDGLSESEKQIAITRPDLPIDISLPSFN